MPRHRFTVLIQSLGMQNKSLDYPFHLQFPIWMRFVWSERPTALLQQITRAKKCAPCVSHSPFRTIMATPLSNLGGASQILPTRPTLRRDSKPQSRWLTVYMSASKNREPKCYPVQVTRRASVSIAMASLLQQLGIGSSQAEEGNGLWLTGPLPVPAVTSEIANKETGTRSFLRNGIYMANIGPQMSAYRLKHYAFDLLALGDLIGQDAWSYLMKYLCLRSTVMYYDFDKVISAAPEEQKQPLTDLAIRLFDSVEKLEEAAKKRSDTMTQACYADTDAILKEVIIRMA